MIISRIGTWIDFIGLTLYVHSIFGSGKILGTFLMARMLPSIFFGPLGGYLADRYSRKTILITCDILRAILVLCFILTKDIYIFFTIGIILSAIDKIFTAAHTPFLSNIIHKEEIMEANSIMKMAYSLVSITGCFAGALVVSYLNFHWIFIVDSVSFVISIICTVLIVQINTDIKQKEKQSFSEEYRESLSFLKTQPFMLFLIILKMIDALGSGSYNTGIPLFSKDFSMPRGSAYGWLIGAWSAGEFTGSFITTYLGKKNIRQDYFFCIAELIMALGMGLTFHCDIIYIAMASIFLGGLGDGISNILFYTVLMKDTPDKMRGKIIGTVSSFLVTNLALGMAIAGFFIDTYKIRTITDFSTGIILLCIITGTILFSIRRYKHD